jgi:methyl-accepting chemotaxis protein/uncharacterized FlaG/YvyC family protein
MMMKPVKSLRTKFILSLFAIMLIIVFLTGIVQIIFIKKQVNNNMSEQANMMAKSIEQGIKASDLASTSIEHQIDLKLWSYAVHIGDQLKGKPVSQITNEELVKMKERFGLAGISIMAREGDDIIGVKASDPKEIGFSFKKVGYIDGYSAMDNMLNGKPLGYPTSYETDHGHVTPIVQSGSHENEPTFFKYAYYVAPNTEYIINPYAESNEINQFIQEVGPETWIQNVKEQNPYVKEIGVLNPQVFKDPSLETKIYPPLKKLVHGSYEYKSDKDTGFLTDMADQSDGINYIQKYQGNKIYKMFLPMDENRTIYIALDYDKISAPIYRHSIIMIISGLISLIALFVLAARFFNRIYENIQKIKNQIKSLASGDFTSKSEVTDGSELEDLSGSANQMVGTLHDVLQETSNQASNVQRLSVILEDDANQSVDKMYQVSMEATMKQRDIVDDILEFIDQVETHLQDEEQNDKVRSTLAKITIMREYARDRASSTTDMTLTLSDLLKSLHNQSKGLADISKNLLQRIQKFKL